MGPTFIVIGAGRSGTTSLHEYVASHPQVFVYDEKSPNFFVADDPLPAWEGPRLRAMARQWVSDAATYEGLFASAGSALARGEVSPVYLQSVNAAARIRARYPDVSIVAILREPVERAYAHYMGRRRDGLDTRPDFAAVVRDELSRPMPEKVAFGSYLGCGRYHHFLRPYYDRFPRERIRVYLYDDLMRDARALMRDLFAFLGVDDRFEPDMARRRGQTGVIGHPLLRWVWTRSVGFRTAVRPLLPRPLRDLASPIVFSELQRPALDPALRAELQPLFAEDIRQLQDLVGHDLSHWLEPRASTLASSVR